MTEKRTSESFTQWGLTYVYVIESTSGHFKIGMSDDPARRLRQLESTKGPFKLNLIFFWGYATRDIASTVEKRLHKEFDRTRANGEWFALSSSDLMKLGGLFAIDYTYSALEQLS